MGLMSLKYFRVKNCLYAAKSYTVYAGLSITERIVCGQQPISALMSDYNVPYTYDALDVASMK